MSPADLEPDAPPPPDPAAASSDGTGPLRDDTAVRRTARVAVRLGIAGVVAAVWTYVQATNGVVSLAGLLAVLLFSGIGWIYGLFTWLLDRKLPKRRFRGRTIVALVLPVLALALTIGGLTSALGRARAEAGLDPATGEPHVAPDSKEPEDVR